jgi:hypothetical protein
LVVIFVCFSHLSSSQDNIHLFAEEGTIWSIGAFNAPYQLTNLDFLLLQGNTQEDEFDDDYYHIVRIGEFYPPTVENTSVALYAKVFEDSILYVKFPDGEPYPIFDYKLGEGEEADLYIFDFYAQTFDPVSVEVESIENISTLLGTRKSWNLISDGGTQWIEGLGNKEGLIYANYGLHCFVGADYFMICAFNGEDHLYQNSIFDDCYITGIKEYYSDENSIHVYPNPFTDKFTLKLIEENSIVKIYNSFGTEILKVESYKPECDIDLIGFSCGVYYLQIKTKKGIVSKTIIKD